MIFTTHLRPGTCDDVEAMFRLDLSCFEEPFRFRLEFMRQCVCEPASIVVVAESGGEMAGFAIANLRRGRARTSAYLTTLDVDPAQRRKGLARRLMAEVERRGLAAGATHVSLHVWTENAGARSFYEALGYIRGRRLPRYYGAAGDAWSYRKGLVEGRNP